MNESLTNTAYDGEYEVDAKLKKSDYIKGIRKGQLLFYEEDGTLRVLRDINSFTSFAAAKNSDFSSNRVVRVLDSIANDVANIFSKYYLGEQYDEEEAKRLQKKIAKNQFDFNDFLSQIAQIKKMGNLKDLASMIPGVGKAIKDIDIDDNAFKSIEAIIYSMTPAERSNPALLNGSRRQRIAKGSGTNIQEVNRLLKQFDQTRKMMKMVTGSKMGKMMPKMK